MKIFATIAVISSLLFLAACADTSSTAGPTQTTGGTGTVIDKYMKTNEDEEMRETGGRMD